MDTRSIRRTRKVLIGGRWFLITGLVFYSLMTTTPFVQAHSEWQRSGWVLGLIVDAAFIMALSAESTLAKYSIRSLGKWPMAFRWITGLSSVFLNVWLSVSERDWVGVAVHLIAPALVMLLAEVGPIYMAALADAERDALTGMREATQQRIADAFGVPMDMVGNTAPPAPEKPAETPEQLILAAVAAAPERVEYDEGEQAPEPPKRPSNKEADDIIEKGWRHKLNPIEVAAAAGRHPATVRRKYKELDAALSI